MGYKMNQEKYNLHWHTYSDRLRDMLYNLRKSEYLTDVTLVCDDQRQFKAHKLVLSACSTVFKNIIDNLPLNCSVIYLRGIQHQEIESILEFMYLGVATFYQERMKEFLNVAKNLGIREISKDVEFNDVEVLNNKEDNVETMYLPNDIHESNDLVSDQPNTETKQFGTGRSSNSNQIVQKTRRSFSCDQCESQFASRGNLTLHIQSIHEGVKYSCTQCDKQFTHESSLSTHIKSKHEEIKYSCNHCEKQFNLQRSLTTHIKGIHEGVKYSCNQCDYQASQPSNLRIHIKSKH